MTVIETRPFSPKLPEIAGSEQTPMGSVLDLDMSNGVEYEVDLPRAYAYYDFAARHGSQDGESMRKKLAEKLSAADAERARAILNELNELTANVVIYSPTN